MSNLRVAAQAAIPLPEPAYVTPIEGVLFNAVQMRAYADAAVAEERERCAALLERGIDLSALAETPNWQKYTVDLLLACASLIRAGVGK